MEQKIIFREMLSEVKALADAHGNVLTTPEIDEFFANTHLTREQMELVYEYLIDTVEYQAGSAEIFFCGGSSTALRTAKRRASSSPKTSL